MKQKPGYFRDKFKKALRKNKQPLNEQSNQTNCGDTNATNYNPNAYIGSVFECIYDDNVMVHIFHMFQVSNTDPMDSGEPNTGPNNYNNYVEGAFFPSGQQGSVANQNLYLEIGSPPPGTWISNAVPGGQSIAMGACFQYIGEFSINDISLGGWAGSPDQDSWGIPVFSSNNLIFQAVTTNLTNNPQDFFWSDSIEECWNEAFEEILGCTDSTAGNYDPYANTDDGSCVPIIEGCTNEEADNFNPEANTDDGSCIISGCTDPTSFNYDETANTDDGSCIEVIEGCTDSTAFNYDETANTDDGSCIDVVEGCTDSTALNYNELANTDDGSCIPIVEGCTNPEAFNYNELANVDNGSCIDVILGCTDEEATNYSINANTDDGSCYYNPGCTDPEAFNYDETADFDDGSCVEIVEGCIDPVALNYDETANTDDGSCDYPEEVEGCTDLEAINYIGDRVINDPTINVTDDGSCYYNPGCTDSEASNYDETADIDDGTCYYNPGCTNPEAFNYDETADFDDGSCVPFIYGCTDPTALNYNELANTDDGSCIPIVEGCTDPTAFNYDPEANTDDGSCVPVVTGCTDENAINYNPEATNDDGSCYYNPGCTDPNAFNYNPEADFDDGSCVGVENGCTDSEAVNYNPEANTDDGSCYYNPGCTDPTAFNYDETADFDDGSCVSVIEGCTDEEALNYNPEANTDDGSCDYPETLTCKDFENYLTQGEQDWLCASCLQGSVPESVSQLCECCPIYGCTDENASNYNPEATNDDGSCEYEGCTDGNALNFDDTATIDDGSCEYPPEGGWECSVCGGCIATEYGPYASEEECYRQSGCTNSFYDSYMAYTDSGSEEERKYVYCVKCSTNSIPSPLSDACGCCNPGDGDYSDFGDDNTTFPQPLKPKEPKSLEKSKDRFKRLKELAFYKKSKK